jgi:hypothetical protein
MKYHVAWFGKTLPENIYQNKKMVEDAGHEFILIHDSDFVGTDKEATIEKDKLFLQLASVTPNGVFFDHDVLLNTLPVFPESDKPYFSIIENNPHIGYFAVNGHPEFFEGLINEVEAKKIIYVWGFTNKILRDKSELVHAIPDSDFEHTMETYNKYNENRINKENFNTNVAMKAAFAKINKPTKENV